MVELHLAIDETRSEIFRNHEIYRPRDDMYDEICIKEFLNNPSSKFNHNMWNKNKALFYELKGDLGIEIKNLYKKLDILELSKDDEYISVKIDDYSGFGNSLIEMGMYLYNYNSFAEIIEIHKESKFNDV